MKRTAIAVCFLLTAGCADLAPKPEPVTTAAPAMRVMGAGVRPMDLISDEDIGFEIRRRLNADPVAMAGVIVEVSDGNVLLRGVVPNLAAAWRAEAEARSVAGVKEVTNQIRANDRLR